MSEVCAWDLDGTIRPGSLLADAVLHGIQAGFIDETRFADPTCPSYGEVDYFVEAITARSRKDFLDVTEKLSDEARQQAYPWALERIQEQISNDQHALILSHSPDFLVRAFARGLGVRRGSGSHFHTSGLVFSGRAVTLDKQRALSRYLRQNELERVAFGAGDTESDLPLLTRAEHGLVVNPSAHLAELAMINSWEIISTRGSNT